MPVDAARIAAALGKVAALVARDVAYAPVFERLEAELDQAGAEGRRAAGVQSRARALLAQGTVQPQRQSAIRRTSPAKCASDAPLP